jgi:hypothetical protein
MALCTVCATADRPVNATPEVQAITVTNSIDVNGLLMSDEDLAWQTTNLGALNNPPLSMPYPANILTDGSFWYPPIEKLGEQPGDIIFWDSSNFDEFTELPSNWGDGQVQYTNTYNEKTVAVSGQTQYLKSSALNTGNKVMTQDNYQTSKQVVFAGDNGGHLVSSESLLLDGAGSFSPVANSVLCPFASTTPPTIWPEFCNIVQMGSSVDMTSVSLSTQAGDRFVSATGDTPVAADYHINVEGISGPASGDLSSYIKTHVQEGRMNYVTNSLDPEQEVYIPQYVYRPGKAEDLSYTETSSTSGLITTFDKVIHYQSGVKLL